MIENTIIMKSTTTTSTTLQNGLTPAGHLFVIDDLAALVNIGYSCQNIFDFIHQCKVISQKLVRFVICILSLVFFFSSYLFVLSRTSVVKR